MLVVDTTDEAAIAAVRDHFGNHGLSISICRYADADLAAARVYPLYFRIAGSDREQVRVSALEASFYLTEKHGISEDCLVILFSWAHEESIGDRRDSVSRCAEVIIQVPPVVFGGWHASSTLMANYELARQMVRDGLQNLDIDIYVRDFFVPLPNSCHGGLHAIRVKMNELLYLDNRAIEEIAKAPRAEDLLAAPGPSPIATDSLAKLFTRQQEEQRRQQNLRRLLSSRGWFMPPCLRRLHWAELSRNGGWEAVRVLARFYAVINASIEEIQHLILRLSRRNNLVDQRRLHRIGQFGVENPSFVGCEHPLLQRFCPVEKCRMIELLDELQNPYLFASDLGTRDGA